MSMVPATSPPALASNVNFRRRAAAAGKRAKRARRRQQVLARSVVEAMDQKNLAEQPLLPRWLSVLLASIFIALLYLAWHAPAG